MTQKSQSRAFTKEKVRHRVAQHLVRVRDFTTAAPGNCANVPQRLIRQARTDAYNGRTIRIRLWKKETQ